MKNNICKRKMRAKRIRKEKTLNEGGEHPLGKKREEGEFRPMSLACYFSYI
jgi:hypothetical protein